MVEKTENTILLVIPCLNEERHLEKLVRDLVAANHDLPMRIVIADGGSTDKTVEIAQDLSKRYSNVLYLHNPKRIQSAAVNLAVATHGESAEFLIRIDAHAGYPEDYCHMLLDEVRATGADSVVVSMDTIGHNNFQKAVAAAQNSKLGNGGSAHRILGTSGTWVDHGHHALMQVDAFKNVGGYDESFSHNEDAELDMRLRKMGFRIWLTGKTAIIYYPRSSPEALFDQYIQYGYGRAKTILKHRTMPKLRQLAPAAVLPALILALFTPFFGLAGFPFWAWCVLCLVCGIKIGMDAKDMRLAMAGPAAMIMHFGWSLGFWRAMFDKARNKL